MEPKRLFRSRTDVMLGGVCGGLAKYVNVDPTMIRLAFVLLLFIGGGGFWIYLVLWFITPVEPISRPVAVEEVKTEKVETVPFPVKTENEVQVQDSTPKLLDGEKKITRVTKKSTKSAKLKNGKSGTLTPKADK
jgi:phage shock protein C